MGVDKGDLQVMDVELIMEKFLIEFRVRDHCWHACSVVGEGKYKKADSKTLY